MKWIIYITMFFQLSISYAQSGTDASFSNVNQLSKKPEKQEVENLNLINLIKNPNATDVFVDGITIDKRAAKYYYEGELQNVNANKARKINFIYLKSFEFTDEFKNLSDECKMRFMNEKDLGTYNYLRKFNERVEVVVDFEGCMFKIYLYSWLEIDQMLNQ